MHIHPAKSLQGPSTGTRCWWRPLAKPTARSACKAEALAAHQEDDDPTFRADLVARIRRQIADGTYGTDEQLEKALEKLFDRLEHDSQQ
jgi:hypothetical protein